MIGRHKTVWQPLSSKRHYREFLLPLKSQFRGLLFLYRYPGYRPPILPKLKLQKFYCFAALSVNHGPVVSTSLVNSDNLGPHPSPTKSESASNKMSRCFLSKLVTGLLDNVFLHSHHLARGCNIHCPQTCWLLRPVVQLFTEHLPSTTEKG